MSTGARDNELKRLYRERDAKFAEIVSCLFRELYSSGGSTLDADCQQLVDEAEELTDNWAVAEADKRRPELCTPLQLLLTEHQEICKRIICVLDTGQSDD